MKTRAVIQYISLSTLAGQIEEVIDETFYRTIWVVADLIDHKYYEQKQHHYFLLAEKDKTNNSVRAKISAVAWRNGSQSIAAFEAVTGQKFGSGIQVLVNVTVSFHQSYGLKLVVNEVDPNFTIGALEQERRNTLYRLTSECPELVSFEGDEYSTYNKSLFHASVIQKVAVLTSKNAVGYKDFKDTIERNRFGYRIKLDLWATAVQGEGNADAICGKLTEIVNSGIGYDAVVIIRGGGSKSDLMIFEQFILAKAVAGFPIPIITGIGHHIDQSIVDLMAHTSVKTPSIAAEFIIAHNRQFEEDLLELQESVIRSVRGLIAEQQQSLSALHTAVISNGLTELSAEKARLNRIYQRTISAGKTVLYQQRSALNASQSRVVTQSRIITSAKACDLNNAAELWKKEIRKILNRQRDQLGYYESLCRVLNPVNILKRGFAVVYLEGAIAKDANGISADDTVSIRMFETKLTATITSKTDLDGTIANL